MKCEYIKMYVIRRVNSSGIVSLPNYDMEDDLKFSSEEEAIKYANRDTYNHYANCLILPVMELQKIY